MSDMPLALNDWRFTKYIKSLVAINHRKGIARMEVLASKVRPGVNLVDLSRLEL